MFSRTTLLRQGIATIAGLVLTAAIGLSTAPLASAATAGTGAPSGWDEVINWESKLCLDTPLDYTAQQEQCTGSETQYWDVPGAGYPILLEDGIADCLGIPGSSTAQGTDAVLTSCADTSNRTWLVEPDGESPGLVYLYHIVNQNSGLCLTDTNTNTAAGTHISQSTCTNDGATLWYFP